MSTAPNDAEKYRELTDTVNDWPLSACSSCGHAFPKEKSFSQKCPVCFKLSRDYQLLAGDKAFLWMQIQHTDVVNKNKELITLVTRLREALKEKEAELTQAKKTAESSKKASVEGLDAKTLKDILFLCHPDRQSSSGNTDNLEKAQNVTAKILVLRDKLNG